MKKNNEKPKIHVLCRIYKLQKFNDDLKLCYGNATCVKIWVIYCILITA